jgi:hypothetical protein
MKVRGEVSETSKYTILKFTLIIILDKFEHIFQRENQFGAHPIKEI